MRGHHGRQGDSPPATGPNSFLSAATTAFSSARDAAAIAFALRCAFACSAAWRARSEDGM